MAREHAQELGADVAGCTEDRDASSSRPPSAPSREAERRRNAANLQRFEYCGRLRALCRPYFLRSTLRESRVMKPAFLRAGRRSGFASRSARVMPCRTATACAADPPPNTLTSVRYWPTVWVTSNGWLITMRDVARGK
jgi:hypothetical protein